MKKSFILAAFMVVLGATMAYAQPRAIGANLGYGIDFSYQHGFGEANMLDVSVNVPFFNGIGGTVTYDWIDPFNAPVPWNNKGEWHWYMGVGGGAGMYRFNAPTWYAGVVGHIGIEYDFWFPFQLSLDWRPNFGVWNDTDNNRIGFNTNGLVSGITLGVRYKF
ncbi:MAG: hypothetical protein IJV55_06775 [Paludibacteraceae bacterium]|nr:hypothetical protein [Paludibacteraceae bacterium]MBQ9705872.1 hypothetical protein [Paludibacteraceae bacterium]